MKKKLIITALSVVYMICFAYVGSVFSLAATLPVFTDSGKRILEYGNLTDDLLISYNYDGSDSPNITYGQAPLAYSDQYARVSLTKNKEYTYTHEGNLWTFNFGKAFLSGLDAGAYWINFTTSMSEFSVEYKLFIKNDNWNIRAEKGSITENGDYVDLKLNKWQSDIAVAGRAIYCEPLDITKPIYIEYSNYTGGWMMFDFNSEPYGYEYVSENTIKSDSPIKIINMLSSDKTGEPARLQGFAGFVKKNGIIPITDYLNTYNSNIFEINIGETASASYVAINGNKISGFDTTVSRSDFPNGKAYLTLYAENETNITLNKKLGGIAAEFNNATPETDYTLKSDTNLQVTLINNADDFTLSYKGSILLENTDYNYTNGILTIMGSYLKTIPYVKQLVFDLSDEKGTCKFRFNTQTGSDVSKASVSQGESIIKYYNGEDTSFKMTLNGESFLNLIKTEGEICLEKNKDYTFASSVLTISKSTLSAWENGTYKLFFETNKGYIELYIIKNDFSKGIADLLNNNSSIVNRAQLKTIGEGEILIQKLFDIENGVNFGLDILSVGNYYLNGNSSGDSSSLIKFVFKDVSTDISAVIIVRANAAMDDSTKRYKTWVDFFICDSEGNKLSVADMQTKTDTVGKHTIKLVSDGENITLNFDDGSDFSLGLGQMSCSSLQLTVISTDKYNYNMVLGNEDVSALEKAINEANDSNVNSSVLMSALDTANSLELGASQENIDKCVADLIKATAAGNDSRGCKGLMDQKYVFVVLIGFVIIKNGFALIKKNKGA